MKHNGRPRHMLLWHKVGYLVTVHMPGRVVQCLARIDKFIIRVFRQTNIPRHIFFLRHGTFPSLFSLARIYGSLKASSRCHHLLPFVLEGIALTIGFSIQSALRIRLLRDPTSYARGIPGRHF